MVTKEELEMFRLRLLADLGEMLARQRPAVERNEWLRSAEVRKMLSLSASALQNLRITGKLCPVKIAGTWYYNREEIEGLFRPKGR